MGAWREGEVELSLTIHAARSTVFRFFTDPVRFARWWAAPGGGMATIEPRVGGEVRIEYHGGGAVMSGRVVELVADERFVFTWGYEKGTDAVGAGASRVEIVLKDSDEGTVLTLRHTGLPTPEQRVGHRFGWRHYLSCMAVECARDQFGETMPRAIAGWFEAWSTADASERGAVLGRCVAEDVELRDAFSCVRGAGELNDHITNARRHMPGLTLGAAGAPQLVHGFVRSAWRTTAPDGKVVFAGVNFVTLDADGRVKRVVGFWDGPMVGA